MLAEAAMGWPEACLGIIGILAMASFFIGQWPWEGFINKTYICKCKRNCPCKGNTDEDEEDNNDGDFIEG